MSIAEKLKTLRKTKNISVYQLSKLSGVSETHIRDLERGDRNPSFDTLKRLAEPLGISLSELFNENADAMYLSDEEKEVVDCFRQLSKDRADSLLGFLKTIVYF
ncbi:MAG: helix-turn-helix transcriptional regulator [Ruminococcaceae bacterium]|nr:helix-turn-helix transcriptional regulator [Oscillospiraceae bacterium]